VGGNFYLGYSWGKNEGSNNYSTNTSESKSHYSYVGLGPFARVYLGELSNKGMPYAQIGGSITFYPGYKGDYKNNTGTEYTYNYSNYHPWSAYGQFGYEHFINSVIGIHYYLSYTYSHYKYTTTYDYPSLPDDVYHYESHSSQIGFGVGLQVHLNCSEKNKARK